MSDVPEIRIGTAEREQALAALSAALSDGRIRSSSSTSAADGSPRPPRAGSGTRCSRSAVAHAVRAVEVSPEPADVDGEKTWRNTVMAVIQFVALALFFVVPIDNSWLFFLLIPATAAILFGAGTAGKGAQLLMEPIEINAGSCICAHLRADERVDDRPALRDGGVTDPATSQIVRGSGRTEEHFPGPCANPRRLTAGRGGAGPRRRRRRAERVGTGRPRTTPRGRDRGRPPVRRGALGPRRHGTMRPMLDRFDRRCVPLAIATVVVW